MRDYAIFALDPDGRIVTWNAGAERIKGYTAQEVIGKHFSLFYTPEALAQGKADRLLRAALEHGSVEDEDWRVRKDGRRFWANAVITALRDAEGVLRGFAKVTRDMTDRRQIDQLQEADRLKNEFLALLAHELRNPLAPIRSAIHMSWETRSPPTRTWRGPGTSPNDRFNTCRASWTTSSMSRGSARESWSSEGT